MWGYDITLTSEYSVENYSKAFYVNFQTKTIDDATDFTTAFSYSSDFTQSAERGLQNSGGSGSRSFTFTKNFTKGQLIIIEAGQTASYGVNVSVSSTVLNPIKKDGYYAFYVTENVTTSVSITIGRANYVLAMQVLTPSNDTYVVNAVTSDGTFLKQIATGSYSSDETIYYPVCVEKDGTYYRKDKNAAEPWWGFTNIAAGLRSVVYSATDYVYYSEVEDMTFYKNGSGFNTLRTDKATSPNRYSGGEARNFYAKQMVYSSPLTVGVYKVTLYARNGGSGARTGISLKLRDGSGNYGSEIASFGTWTAAECAEKYIDNVLVPDGYSICVYESTNNNSDIQIDYVCVTKVADVTDINNIVGAVDMSTDANAANSQDYTLRPGDSMKFTFKNHGTTYGNNWRISVKEGSTWKANVCADSYDYTANAETKTSYLMSTDGGSSKVALNWDRFAEDMADATVEATLNYVGGTLELVTKSTGAANGYIYYVDQDVTGLTAAVTVNLSVNHSWLEILSATESVTVTSAGYATYVSANNLDFTSTGIKAYTAKVNGASKSVVMTQINKVPAGTPVILYKEDGATENVPVATTTDTPAENDLIAGTGAAVATDGGEGKINYILNNVSGIGFYKAAGQTVAANRAYLQTTVDAATARMTMIFEDEDVTSIGEELRVKSEEFAPAADFYDLQGRKVAQPQKGLYIVNGKKVVLK